MSNLLYTLLYYKNRDNLLSTTEIQFDLLLQQSFPDVK